MTTRLLFLAMAFLLVLEAPAGAAVIGLDAGVTLEDVVSGSQVESATLVSAARRDAAFPCLGRFESHPHSSTLTIPSRGPLPPTFRTTFLVLRASHGGVELQI